MKRVVILGAVILFASSVTFAAEKSWTGKISDSSCGASHKSAIEHAGKKMTDRGCTEACIKNGAKYVFVAGGKVYDIENQDYTGLADHAGHTVKLTGEMTGKSIKVSNITMGGGKKTKM